MRWVLVTSAFVIALASCGKIVTATDGGVGDASVACKTNADCSNGTQCRFAVSDGCIAVGACIAAPPIGNCKGEPACACDGTSTSVCNSTATVPVESVGFCPVDASSCSGVACEECDVSGYAPLAMSQPISHANECSPNDVSAFVTACMSTKTGSPTACDNWENAEQTSAGACAACIFTLTTAAAWGPLVCNSQGCFFNAGGCIDVELDEVSTEQGSGGAGSCGDLVNASNGCDDFACAACSSTSDFDACASSAQANECKTYLDAETTSTLCFGEAGAAPCAPVTDSDDIAFVNIFCGP